MSFSHFQVRISHGMNLLHHTTSHFTYIYIGCQHLLVGRKPFLIAGFTIFQFFWDDDPYIYNDNECYQTYQTFKPGKTEKKQQKIPRVVAVFHVFSQGPWGGDMGLIAGIEAWSSVLLGLGIAALSGKLVGGARGFRIDMPMSSRKSGDIWKLKVGVEDVELVNTPW